MDSLPGNVPIQLGPGYATEIRPNVKTEPTMSASNVIIPSSKSGIPNETGTPTATTTLTDDTGATLSIVAQHVKLSRTGVPGSAPLPSTASSRVAHVVSDGPAVTSLVAHTQANQEQSFITTILRTQANDRVEKIFVKQVDVTVTMTEPAVVVTQTVTMSGRRNHRRGFRH